MEHESSLPIKQEELKNYVQEVATFIKNVHWSPAGNIKKSDDEVGEEAFRLLQNIRATAAHSGKKAYNVSLGSLMIEFKKKLGIKGRLAWPATVNHITDTVETGLSIGLYLRDMYFKASGLRSQIDAAVPISTLSETQKVKYNEQQRTAAVIALYGAAYYIVWTLKKYRSDAVSSIEMNAVSIPEVSIEDSIGGLECMLFYYGKYMEADDFINDELKFIKYTVNYFQGMLDEIDVIKDGLSYAEPFQNRSYKLENSDFVIDGFSKDIISSVSSIEFNEVSMNEIVGNDDFKHLARRIAERLVCYDRERKANAFLEFGAFPTISMGYGPPGTGKSMLIAAVATELRRMCKELNIPFLFWPFPDNIVSTYQGGSAERAVTWFKQLQSTDKIIFAPIDDAENNLQERTMQGVSAGVREVIGVLLRNTEGAYAVNHGNYVMMLFTNIPEQIDRAVLSRIQHRAPIDGAVTVHDMLDQDYLWWSKHQKLDDKFVNLNLKERYAFLDDQKQLKTLDEITFDLTKDINSDFLKDLYNQLVKEYSTDTFDFHAQLIYRFRERFPTLTSRDKRNIHKSVDFRIMDFSLPEDYWKDLNLFFLKDYDAKFNIIKDLKVENMKGLSFNEIWLDETMKYLDNWIDIADNARQRQVEQLVENTYISKLAAKDFTKKYPEFK